MQEPESSLGTCIASGVNRWNQAECGNDRYQHCCQDADCLPAKSGVDRKERRSGQRRCAQTNSKGEKARKKPPQHESRRVHFQLSKYGWRNECALKGDGAAPGPGGQKYDKQWNHDSLSRYCLGNESTVHCANATHSLAVLCLPAAVTRGPAGSALGPRRRARRSGNLPRNSERDAGPGPAAFCAPSPADRNASFAIF